MVRLHFKSFVSILISFLISWNLCGQDEARIGVNLGYSKSANFTIVVDPFSYTAYTIGVERQFRLPRIAFVYGLNYSQTQLTISESRFPSQPELKTTIHIPSFYAETRLYFIDRIAFAMAGFILEYDFGFPKDTRYSTMNGFGAQGGIGFDVHISRDFVCTIMPSLRVRQLFVFQNRQQSTAGTPSSFSANEKLDFNLMFTTAYKFF